MKANYIALIKGKRTGFVARIPIYAPTEKKALQWAHNLCYVLEDESYSIAHCTEDLNAHAVLD